MLIRDFAVLGRTWWIKHLETLLYFIKNFATVFNFFWIWVSSVKTHADANKGQDWKDMGFKIGLSLTVPRYSLDDSEDALLGSHFKEVDLFEHAGNRTAAQDSSGVFKGNFFVGLDANFKQINEADGLLHQVSHTFQKSLVYQVIGYLRKNVHESG